MDMRQLLMYCMTAALVLALGGCGQRKDMETIATVTQTTAQTTAPAGEATESTFPENQEVQDLAEGFAEAYFQRDRETMRPYLVESYGMLLDVYPWDTEPELIGWQLPDSVTAEYAMRGACVARLTFDAGNGRQDCLTLELVREEKEWKIRSYGLE